MTGVATRDVDAVFEADKVLVRELTTEIARERGWPPDWLNDGVKGYLSNEGRDARNPIGSFPPEDEPGLRVFTAAPHYLFAMKCRAMRLGGGEDQSDLADIRQLARELGTATAAQAFAIIESYFPGRPIEPKTQFGLQELFSGGG